MHETELLEVFWREHGRKIYNLALRMLGDPAAAEDVTQETFLRAWTALKNGQEIASPGSWLARVAVNAVLDELRRRRRKSFCAYPLEEEGLPATHSTGPEDAVLARELYQEVWLALGRLKPSHRLVLVARTVGGLSTEEVAEALGVSPGYVRVLFNRAAGSLRKELLRKVEEKRGIPAACRECRHHLVNPATAQDPGRRAKMEEHLAGCPACRKVAERFRDSYYGLGLLPLAELPPRLKTGLFPGPLTANVPPGFPPPASPVAAAEISGWGKKVLAAKLTKVAAAGLLFLGVLVWGWSFWTLKHAPNAPSLSERGGESVSGPVNGSFESGDLTGWAKTWSKTPPGAPDPVWDVSVGTGYAHSARYGCRIYLAGRSERATAGLSTVFVDGSPSYTLWIYLRGGARGPRSQLCLTFSDLEAQKTVQYRGTIGEAAEANEGDVCFRLTEGTWSEHCFPFAEDYRAKYGAYPGSYRMISISLLDSSRGSEPGEVYIDDLRGK